MELIKLKVDKQNIVADRQFLVSDTENVYVAEYEFDEEWDNYSIRFGVFKLNNGDIKQVLLQDNKCLIPNESVANDGYLLVGVYGVSGDKRYPTIWTTSPIHVQLGARQGTEPLPPTPSEWEQVLSHLSNIEEMLGNIYTKQEIDELLENVLIVNRG